MFKSGQPLEEVLRETEESPPWRHAKHNWRSTWTTWPSATCFQLAYIITRDPSEHKLFWFCNWLSCVALLQSKAAEGSSSSSNQLQSGNATTSARECSWRPWGCLHSFKSDATGVIQCLTQNSVGPRPGKAMKSPSTEHNKTIFKKWVEK